MIITKLSLTNFKSFKDTQIIELAPVTLLFGPNSVGKSSVIMALFYCQQILERGHCNPQRIEALGGKFVGGFKNLVYGRDLNRSIKIKVEYDKLGTIGSSYCETHDLVMQMRSGEAPPLLMDEPSRESNKVAVELQVSWSKAANTAYVSEYSVWLDDVFLGKVTSDQGLKNPVVSELNFDHKTVLPYNNEDWIKDYVEDGGGPLSNIYKGQFGLEVEDSGIPYEEYFTEDGMSSEFEFQVGSQFPVGIGGISGALPILGKKLKTTLSLDSDVATAISNEVLSEAFTSPLDNLLKILTDSLCIGPLRMIPDSTYQPNPYPSQSEWHNGLAAWDVLDKANIELLKQVDEWIRDEKHLNLGYGIAIKVEKQFAEIKKIGSVESYNAVEKQLESMITTDSFTNKREFEFDEQNTNYKYTLWDADNRIDVLPCDIGVGISQLMPLVVAALSRKKGLIAIEQPELHVHPRVQVAIGDLLIQLDSTASFLIETHSEHLILRLRKRVRQTTENELPEGFKPVRHDDISIVYFEPSAEGVIARRIKLDEDGEFTSKWPQGFFSERRGEYL
jgi:predicted ATPase